MKILSVVLLVLVSLFHVALAQTDVISYVDNAISIFETNWEKADTVDWESVREDYLARAQSLTTTEEAHPLVRDLIKELGDSWAYLHVERDIARVPKDQTGFRVLLPDWVVVYVFEESPAEAAGLKVGDQILSVDGKPLTSGLAANAPFQPNAGAIYTTCGHMNPLYCELLRNVYEPNAWLEIYRQSTGEHFLFRADGTLDNNLMRPNGGAMGDIGYLELTVLKLNSDDYKSEAAKVIKTVNETPTCGWIIDVRRHAGGRGPYVHSVISLIEQDPDDLPIALLISPLTYSAGEHIVQVLLPNRATTFGEPTGGQHPTALRYPVDEDTPLAERSYLAVTTFSRVIEPDVLVANDWTRFQMEDDPVIQAARDWLESQPACAE